VQKIRKYNSTLARKGLDLSIRKIQANASAMIFRAVILFPFGLLQDRDKTASDNVG